MAQARLQSSSARAALICCPPSSDLSAAKALWMGLERQDALSQDSEPHSDDRRVAFPGHADELHRTDARPLPLPVAFHSAQDTPEPSPDVFFNLLLRHEVADQGGHRSQLRWRRLRH
eukprot:scaffold870_cov268-Pinguiococcus_pyrenoidosus.AAC.17